jgi:hypothetical protein
LGSRAQLSPVGRPTALRRSLPVLTGTLTAGRAPASTIPIGQFWNPTLLDRLQAPLTRYHD